MPKHIEDHIRASLALFKESPLKSACSYALLSGGKKIRAKLVLEIAKLLAKGRDVSKAALAVEFFHTASLAADDLPCMDDDDERRASPSLHKVYGETLALLASYALIAEGYGFLADNADLLVKNGDCSKEEAALLSKLSLKQASLNTGFLGATGGQFEDLAIKKKDPAAILDIIEKKTASLFELSFVLGWLFGGGDPGKLSSAKQAGYHFGIAFQLKDDLEDMIEDQKRECYSNAAIIFGKNETENLIQKHMNSFYALLIELQLPKAELFNL